MARLFVAADRLGAATAGSLVLQGDDHHYLTKVLRLVGGDMLSLFDGQGLQIAATVVSVGSREVVLALGARTQTASVGVEVTLLVAIPKGERMDWLVEKTTELGVARIVPVITARSVVKPSGGSEKTRRWEALAAQAARQSGQARIPQVADVQPLATALATPLVGRGFVLWERSEGAPLVQALASVPRACPVSVLVGPEGGLTQAEVEGAGAAGFAVVGLGPRILRVETAALAAVALVQGFFGRLGLGPGFAGFSHWGWTAPRQDPC